MADSTSSTHVRGLLCDGCNTNLGRLEYTDIHSRLMWISKQIDLTRQRLDLYEFASPRYVERVRRYVNNEPINAEDDDDPELLKMVEDSLGVTLTGQQPASMWTLA